MTLAEELAIKYEYNRTTNNNHGNTLCLLLFFCSKFFENSLFYNFVFSLLQGYDQQNDLDCDNITRTGYTRWSGILEILLMRRTI